VADHASAHHLRSRRSVSRAVASRESDKISWRLGTALALSEALSCHQLHFFPLHVPSLSVFLFCARVATPSVFLTLGEDTPALCIQGRFLEGLGSSGLQSSAVLCTRRTVSCLFQNSCGSSFALLFRVMFWVRRRFIPGP
jgi:hypothetical protein